MAHLLEVSSAVTVEGSPSVNKIVTSVDALLVPEIASSSTSSSSNAYSQSIPKLTPARCDKFQLEEHPIDEVRELRVRLLSSPYLKI